MTCYSFRKRLLAFFFGSLLCLQAQAVVITATATDLADATGDPDRWQITYRIGGELPTDFGVNLLFPILGFDDLALVPDSVSSTLDPSLSPSLAGTDGVLSLRAMVDIGVGEFGEASLTFVRLAPFADQNFEEFNPEFTLLGTLTIAIAPTNDVPEPTTLALMGLGVALLGRAKGRRARPALTAPA